MDRIISLIKTAVRETDKLLLTLCITASAFGLLMVTSATRNTMGEGDVIPRDTKAMLIAILLGTTAALVISFVDYNLISKLFPFIGGFCILLMIITLLFGIGPEERPDARTWIRLGTSGFYFQPSELVKIGFIITFGFHLELVRDRMKKVTTILFLCLHGAVPVILVILSGDMGSALVFLIIFAVMMFSSDVPLRYFLIGGAAVCAAIPFAWTFILDDIQKNRVLGLLYPDLYEDILYQQQVGQTALKNGGLTGMGLFKGTYTQAGIVPESENDMIFTVFGEELGLLGCLLAMGLIIAICTRLVQNGMRSRFHATELMCYGTAAMIAGQTVINIGMCLMRLPVIGITLPFYSAGGSSSLCLYVGIGLMLSIYRFDKEQEVTNFRYSRVSSPFAGE